MASMGLPAQMLNEPLPLITSYLEALGCEEPSDFAVNLPCGKSSSFSKEDFYLLVCLVIPFIPCLSGHCDHSRWLTTQI